MKGKGIISFFFWLVLFSTSKAPIISNEECPKILFHSGTIEPGPVFPEQFSHQSKNFNLLSMNQVAQNETQSKGKSLNVMRAQEKYSYCDLMQNLTR